MCKDIKVSDDLCQLDYAESSVRENDEWKIQNIDSRTQYYHGTNQDLTIEQMNVYTLWT